MSSTACLFSSPKMHAFPARGAFAPEFLSVPSPAAARGAERREAHLTSALRRCALGERALAFRRSTCGSCQQLSPSLSSGPGFRGPGIGARLVQQAPCRAVLMPPDRGPGAARVRGYEPRPQAPHLLRLSERLRKTPLNEQGGSSMYIILEQSRTIFTHISCAILNRQTGR